METWPHHIVDNFLQIDLHSGLFLQYIPPIPVPVPGVSLHLSAGTHFMPEVTRVDPASNGWTVWADCLPVVSRGHECALVVAPHLNIDLESRFNLTFSSLIVGSSTICEYAVGSVRCEDGPIAVSVYKLVGFNWSCNDTASVGFYAPICPVFNYSTISIGFTPGDLIASLLCVLFDSLVADLTKKLGEALHLDDIAKRIFDTKLFSEIFDSMLKSQFMAFLRSAAIPRIFRGEGGRFASTAETLGQDALSGALEWLVGEDVSKIADGLSVTSNNGLANRLGALIDGNSEALGY